MPGLWRVNLKRWAVPLALAAANLLLLAVYVIFYAGRVEAGVERVGATSAELEELTARRTELEAYLEQVESRRAGVELFYSERLGTEAERLTSMIAEIKQLAATAGLEPSAISYDRTAEDDFGLVKRTINFAVAGSYLELRRLVNLFELSDYFLILEQISISEGAQGGSELRINLRLASYFVQPEGEGGSAGRRAAG